MTLPHSTYEYWKPQIALETPQEAGAWSKSHFFKYQDHEIFQTYVISCETHDKMTTFFGMLLGAEVEQSINTCAFNSWSINSVCFVFTNISILSTSQFTNNFFGDMLTLLFPQLSELFDLPRCFVHSSAREEKEHKLWELEVKLARIKLPFASSFTTL